MTTEISREKFIEGIGKAEKISGKHVSLPILSSVLMQVKKNEVVFVSTNLDVGIEVQIPAKGEDEYSFVIKPEPVKSFLLGAKGQNVSLEKRENVLEMRVGDNVATVKIESPEEFPTIPRVSEGKEWFIASKDLTKGIKAVLWSASTSTIKPEIGSVYIYQNEEDVVFVATDSFRLAEKKIKAKKAKDFEPLLIPTKNASEIIKILDGVSSEVKVISSKNQISFEAEGTYLTSRLVDGNFPDYKQIIPKEFNTEARILKEDLSSVLRTAAVFSDSFHQATLTFIPKDKSLEVKTRSNEVGESVCKIKGSLEGNVLSMNFNHRYLADPLQSIEGEGVLISAVSESKPLIIKNSGGSDFLYLVMPMNR